MAESESSASESAKKLSKLGAPKGGRARANVLSPAERSEIAKKASHARWTKAGKALAPQTQKGRSAAIAEDEETEVPYSMFRGDLQIDDLQLECHVLSDRRRVLTQREVVRVISGGRISGNLSRYLERNPLYTPALTDGRTINFAIPGSPTAATGYDAELFVEICELYLDARSKGLLKPSQNGLALTAEIIVRACAKVGITALVDEATGYQEVREKRALQLKLQAFIAEDMQEWARMFPEEFWLQLARLEGVRYSPRSRPLRWGKYVMAFVYDAIDPDIGRELRKINPNPRHRKNHHQWLQEFGRERVNNQIQQVIAIMKLCDDMNDFKEKFNRVFKHEPYQLSFLFD